MTGTAREDAIRRLKAKRDLRSLAATAVAVSGLVTIIWALTGADYFWPVWVMVGFGFALASSAWRIYGPGSRPITQTEIEQEMRGGR